MVAAYVSQQLQLDADLAAKWAALGLLARLMHPVVYMHPCTNLELPAMHTENNSLYFRRCCEILQ